MVTYLNTRNHLGTETIDELDSADFETEKEFKKELNRLVSEYHLSGINVYTSKRCTKDWKLK
jgi:hypothetical protein